MCAAHVFLIDAAIADRASLLSDLPEGSAWAILDGARDGLHQAREILAGFSGLLSVHLLCHGTPGMLRVGNTSIGERDLASHGEDLAAIGASLAEEGDLLLYGCRVADGDAGRRFVDALAAHAGVRVAASTTLTGNPRAGGDWRLDYHIGAVCTPAITPAAFEGVLMADEYGTTIATAGSIAVGASLDGTLETTSDKDWYAIQLIAGLVYTFTLDGSGLTPVADPNLRLYAPNTNLVASDDDGGVGSNSLLVFTPEVTGTYYLEAGGWSSVGGYTLGTAQTDLYAEGIGTTGLLSPGDVVFGDLETVGDQDWFRISLVAGQTYTFTLDRSGATPMDDPRLLLYNAAGRMLDSDDNGGGDPNALITYTASSSGTYYIVADGWGSDTGGYTLAMLGPADVTPPSIAFANPSDESAAVDPSANLVFTFDEAIQRGTGVITLQTGGLSGTVLESFSVATSSRVVVSDATLILDPTIQLDWNNTYRVVFSADSVRDIAGNGMAAYNTYNFSTAAQPATPYVLSFAPADEAANAAIGANVVLTFNEPIQRGAGTISLRTDAGVLIESFDAATSPRVEISGSTFTLDPTASLAYNTGYVVEFGPGTVKNLSGTPWAGTGAYEFWTAVSASDDYAANTATHGSVPIGASVPGAIDNTSDADWFAVTLQQGLHYEFSMDGTGLTPLSDPEIRLRDELGYRITSDDDGGGNHNALLEFSPLKSGVFYLDVHGWGSTGQYTLSAALVDDFADDTSTGGAIAIGSAASGRIDVPYDQDWFRVSLEAGQTYTFALDGATAAPLVDPVLLLRSASGHQIDADDNGGNELNSLLSFTPTTSGTYYIIADAWGSDTGGYVLSTSGPADVTAPTMVDFEPLDELVTFDPHGNVVISFSEAIARGTGTITLIADSDTVVETFDAATSTRLSIYDAMLTLDPSHALDWGTHYRVVFAPATVRDLAGNAFAGIANYDFTTAPDPVAPQAIAFGPVDEAANAAITANVVVAFNEPIQRGAGTIFLKTGAGAVVESFDAATSPRIAVDGATLTLDPTANLAYNSAYRVEFAAGCVRDLEGNPWAGTSAYNFWTALSSSDDYAANATTNAVLAIGGSADGRVDAGSDFDWFAVHLVQGMGYEFRLDRATTDFLGDPDLRLFDAVGTELDHDDSGGLYNNALISFTAPATDTYYLRAGGWGSTPGNYTIGASLADDVAGDASTAASLLVGRSAAGRIDSSGDQDWFRVALTAGVQYTFALDGATVAPVDDLRLEIRNGAGTVVASDDNDGAGNNALLTYTPNASGTYYAIARSWSGDDTGGYLLSATGPTDTTPPFVLSFVPDDESTGVALGSNVAVTFDESIKRGTGTILLKLDDGSIVESFDAASSNRINVTGSVLTLDPTANLLASTHYTVELPAGSVKDVPGNPGPAIIGYDFWTADAFLSIAAASASKAEGNSGTTPFTFSVTRTGDLNGPSSAAWSLSSTQATAADFTGAILPSGTVEFAVGEVSKTIEVPVSGDVAAEYDESFAVTLSVLSGARLLAGSASGTIVNDDGTPTALSIAPADAVKSEGNSGTTSFFFTVTRTGDLAGASSVDWSVSGAVSGADFVGGVLPSGTLSFGAGETAKQIVVQVAGDTVVEPDEGFTVTLSNPSNAALGTATANGTVVNDDPIQGTPGPDVLNGTSGNDIILGLGGNDTISGLAGNDTIDGGTGTDTAAWNASAANYTLGFSGQHLIVHDAIGPHGTDTLSNVERLQFTDKSVIVETATPTQTYTDVPEGLYHFFIVAFDAAPGVTYMDQLADAWHYFLPQLGSQTLQSIVEIFTGKSQFTDVYPLWLTNQALATELVQRVIKDSASVAAKEESVTYIADALDLGWSRGKVIYTVFGNLAAKEETDPTWGGTAKQFANEIEVAKYYTEVLHQSTTDVPTLRDIIAPVTQYTDVSSPEVIATLIGHALMDG